MALVYKDLVLETTTTTGTGTLTLAGAVTGHQTFAAIGNGNTCYYVIRAVDAFLTPTGAWEVGLGTYTSAGTTLARTSVLASSNSGSAVNFAAGTKIVGNISPASFFSGLGRTLVQKVRTDTGAMATGTTTVPHDDTIMQNTEGDQYLSQAITPVTAGNLLHIKAQLHLSCSATNWIIAGLFVDSTANALTVAYFIPTWTATAGGILTIDWWATAAGTSATTFKIRAGPQFASTVTFNGDGAVAQFGGVLNSFLEITEWAQ